MIYIAADHAGFELKKEIIKWLCAKKIEIEDLGPTKFNPEDDYPDFAFLLGKKVRASSRAKGILICRSGIGMAIAVNKVKGIRAALCTYPLQAQKAREHNDCNVLVLAADFTKMNIMKRIIVRFLNTKFLGERHARRIKKIMDFEKGGLDD